MTSEPKQRWSRLPSKWIGEHGLRAFGGGERLGTSMSALKVFVALVLRAENKAVSSAGENQGSSSLSYDDLSELTDVSRPMLSPAIRMLEERGLVSVKHEGVGRKNRYFLSGYGAADPWAKVSNQRLYGTGSSRRVSLLHQVSPRRLTDMHGLKLYLLLCAFRDTKTNTTMIAYDKIQAYSGIPEARIRRAISVLVEHDLIQVSRRHVSSESANRPNRYEIRGIGELRPSRNVPEPGKKQQLLAMLPAH